MCESKVLYKGSELNPAEIKNYTPKLPQIIGDNNIPENSALVLDKEGVFSFGIIEGKNFYPLQERFNRLPQDIAPETALKIEKNSLISTQRKNLTLILNKSILRE